eukprot:141620-Pleurochrysis_carterae.AAC.1
MQRTRTQVLPSSNSRFTNRWAADRRLDPNGVSRRLGPALEVCACCGETAAREEVLAREGGLEDAEKRAWERAWEGTWRR